MSSRMDEIFACNKAFVENKGYEEYLTDKLPNKKLAILTCMDARLTELLPAALGLRNGDAKVIKNAGGTVTHPFGSVMRSLLVCIYEMEVEEIAVVGHHDCGMLGFDPQAIVEKMLARGIPRERLAMLKYCGVDLGSWLVGFASVQASVQDTVALIRQHPLVPEDVNVHGLLIDPVTGRLSRV
ncbi:MAG: carbonic anhydrase [Betaproteobacteria bacterium]|nr:carbonic anhydrase [Betaproteobacteria bacterium]